VSGNNKTTNFQEQTTDLSKSGEVTSTSFVQTKQKKLQKRNNSKQQLKSE
jgi:hypothetical protein